MGEGPARGGRLPILAWAGGKTDSCPYEVPKFMASSRTVHRRRNPLCGDFISRGIPLHLGLNIWYHTQLRLSHPHQRRDGFSVHIRGAVRAGGEYVSLTAGSHDAWVENRYGRSYVSDGGTWCMSDKQHLVGKMAGPPSDTVDVLVTAPGSGTTGLKTKRDIRRPGT